MRIRNRLPQHIINRYNSYLNSVKNNIERLTTGKQINSSIDNAANLAISQRAKSINSGTKVAINNVQNGISMLQFTEERLGSINDILQNMKTLAIYRASDTLNPVDNKIVLKKLSQFKTEIDRIAENTKFNGIQLLTPTSVTTEELIGETTEEITTTDKPDLEISDKENLIEHKVDIKDFHIDVGFRRTKNNSLEVTITNQDNLLESIIIDKNNSNSDPPNNGSSPNTPGNGKGADNPSNKDKTDNTDDSNKVSITLDNTLSKTTVSENSRTETDLNLTEAIITFDNAYKTVTEITIEGALTTNEYKENTEKHNKEQINLQLGPKSDEKMSIQLKSISSEDLNLTDLGLDKEKDIKIINNAIEKINSNRTGIGSYMNVLHHRLNYLQKMNQSHTAAISRITDVDMAQEFMELTRNNILVNKNKALMAHQKRIMPQMALNLLEVSNNYRYNNS